MDTIAINAREAIDENGKNNKINNTEKVAMAATGVITVKTIIDSLEGDTETEVDNTANGQNAQVEEIVPEADPAEVVVVEVNPDDVMLEEPVTEPSTETDMIAEVAPQSSDEDPYRPFANNDNISDDVFPEPQSDEVLIAENMDVDVIVEDDPSVDMICGMPETEPEIIEEQISPDAELYADNGSSYDDSSIQSDLMA